MRIVIALALIVAVAGCDRIRRNIPDVDLQVGGADRTEVVERVVVPPGGYEKRLVARVDRLEVGTTADGYALTAFGQAPATGWFAPQLRARNDGDPGLDGYLELDLVAAPPELNKLEPGVAGTPEQLAIRGDFVIPTRLLARISGVRVYAQAGSIQGTF